MNEVYKAIKDRRTHRVFMSDALPEEQLEIILDAALSSPSANNAQPWHFSVVQNQELLNKISNAAAENALLKPKDQRSPRFDDPAFQVFYHAPTVIFLSAPADRKIAWVDCGIAVNNIALIAHSLGLGSVILGLPREAFESILGEELKEDLLFPSGNEFVIAIALGRYKDSKLPPEKQPGRVSRIK